MKRVLRLAVVAALGVWLMFAPWVLGHEDGAAETSDRIVGPLIVMFSVVAMSGATRAVRWANLPLAGWLLVGPLFAGFPPIAALNDALVGLAVAIATVPRVEAEHAYGGGWRALVRRSA